MSADFVAVAVRAAQGGLFDDLADAYLRSGDFAVDDALAREAVVRIEGLTGSPATATLVSYIADSLGARPDCYPDGLLVLLARAETRILGGIYR